MNEEVHVIFLRGEIDNNCESKRINNTKKNPHVIQQERNWKAIDSSANLLLINLETVWPENNKKKTVIIVIKNKKKMQANKHMIYQKK